MMRSAYLGLLPAMLLPMAAIGQAPPASPASSTEKPGSEETAPKPDGAGWIVSGSSRLRIEAVDGRPRPGLATGESAVLLRTGLALEYGPGPLSIGGELIDSRGYGLDRRTALGRDDIDAVELPQAYLRLKLPDALGQGRELDVQGGRFLINIGSGRLVATDEYRNTVNGFTGVHARLTLGGTGEIGLFYVLPQDRLPDAPADIRRNRVRFDRETVHERFLGVHALRKDVLAGSRIEAAYYHLAEEDSPGRATADRRLDTLDLRLSREPKGGRPDLDLEGAWQTGGASSTTDPAARRAPVAAGFFHAAVGYTLPGAWKPRLGLFYDYATGDRGGRRFTRFDTLFGSRRDDLGPSGTYAALARENVSAPGLRLELKPRRFELLADYRGVWLASARDRFYGVVDRTGASGRFAGQQVEGRVRYWLVPGHLRLESNFAILFKGRFLLEAPQAQARGQREVRFLETNIQATF